MARPSGVRGGQPRAPAGAPKPASGILDPASSTAPWRIYNVGNRNSVQITKVLAILEKELGRTATKEMVEMQPGDALETCANTDDLMREVGFQPSTPIEEGLKRFVAWFRSYHST